MVQENLTALQAMRRVKLLKPETFEPRPTFAVGLKQWEDILSNSQRSKIT
jgi:hypothetical protein